MEKSDYDLIGEGRFTGTAGSCNTNYRRIIFFSQG